MSAPKLTEGERRELRMIRDGHDLAIPLSIVESYIADGLVQHGPDGPQLTDAGRAALKGGES